MVVITHEICLRKSKAQCSICPPHGIKSKTALHANSQGESHVNSSLPNYLSQHVITFDILLSNRGAIKKIVSHILWHSYLIDRTKFLNYNLLCALFYVIFRFSTCLESSQSLYLLQKKCFRFEIET